MEKIKIKNKYTIRQCISCRQESSASNLISITRHKDLKNNQISIHVNASRFNFGRSAYICNLINCINIAIKGKKISKMLRVSSEECSKAITFLEEHFINKGVVLN